MEIVSRICSNPTCRKVFLGSRHRRKCDVCVAAGKQAAKKARRDLAKKNKGYRNYDRDFSSPRHLVTKRGPVVSDPATDQGLVAAGVRHLNSCLDIGASGPVRQLRPGDPEFAELATFYMVRDAGLAAKEHR